MGFAMKIFHDFVAANPLKVISKLLGILCFEVNAKIPII